MVVVQPAHVEFRGQTEQNYLLMSDLHLGASCCDLSAIRADLERAKEIDATILINGDVFDAILPGDRKRYDPRALAPEFQGRANIVSFAVDYACGLLEPYAHRIGFIGLGNHETALERHHSIDPISVLIDRLNSRHGASIAYGGIGGYYRQYWVCPPRCYSNLTIRYHHGAGGASPVTKGIIDFARFDRWVSDADVLWIGHKHNRFVDSGVCERLTQSGAVVTEPRLYVMSGAYLTQHRQTPQEAQQNRMSSYAQDFNLAPQRPGGVWLNVQVHRFKASIEKRITATL